MSDCTDDEAPSDTVCLSALLGIKGGLRLRRDPTEQRPHIILRRVVEEDSDDSSDEEESPAPRKTRVEFRLYSHKHLNLKPGRELLLAVESENDAFEKQLFTFEGDIDASDEDSEQEDTTVAEEPAQVDDDDEEEVDLPYAAMPPKLRRRELLTKKDEVSRVVQLPVKRTVAHASVGVQTTASSYASTSVQAIPIQSSVAQQTTPTLYASTSAQTQSMQAELSTPLQSVVATSVQTQSDLSFSNPVAYRPPLTIDIPCVESGDEMEISPVGSEVPLNESFPSSPSHAVPDSDHSSSPTLVTSDLATCSPHEDVSGKSILHFETKAQARDSIALEVPDEPMPSSTDACPPRLPTPESVIRRRQATKAPPTEPAAFRAAAASASGGTPLPTGPSALRKATATASCSRPPAPPPTVPPPPLPMIPRGVVISAKGKERAPEESEATVVDIAEAKEAAAVVISTGPYSNRLNIRPSSSAAVIIPPQPRPADSSTSSSTAQKKKVVINVGGPIVARTKKGSAGTQIDKDAARAKAIDIDYASRSPSPETGSCSVEPENKWKRIAPVFVPASVGHVPVAPASKPTIATVDTQPEAVRKNVFEIEEEKQAVGRAASKDKSIKRDPGEPSRKKRKVDGDQSVNSEVPASPSLPNSPSKSQPVLAHPLPMKPSTDLSGSLRRIKRERSPSPVLTIADNGRPQVRSSKRDRSRSADSRRNEPERPWKAIQASDVCALGGDGALGVVQIVFNSDGSRFALLCENNTLRIWDSVYMLELARLSLSSTAELAWMEKDLVSLSRDGVVRKWKQKGSHWERVPLVCLAPEHCSEDDKLCLAVARGRIAVSSPRFGVNAWIWTNGAWVAQRAIARTKVTALKFIDGGDALVGGTIEGVVWHSAVPNGTLKAYAFLQSGITSIAISPTGSEAVVSQAHGPACTVLLGPQENKRLKQAYAGAGSVTVGAQFTSNGNLIVYGTPEGCLAFCDKQTGSIVYRTENQEGDIQVMACCEGPRPSVLIGTQRGRLVRWEAPRYQPVVGGRRKRSKLK